MGNPVQRGHGISDFLGSLTRTAQTIIFPNLVRLGRAVVGDVLSGSSLVEAAAARTMETVANIGDAVHQGAGRRHPRKQARPK